LHSIASPIASRLRSIPAQSGKTDTQPSALVRAAWAEKRCMQGWNIRDRFQQPDGEGERSFGDLAQS